MLLSQNGFSRTHFDLRDEIRQCYGIKRFGYTPFRGANKGGKPLTVTDPHMTRFLMSLEEAVQLVLYAFENAETGDIFVQSASCLCW